MFDFVFEQSGRSHLRHLLDAHQPVPLSGGQQSGAPADGDFYHGKPFCVPGYFHFPFS